MNRMLLFVTLCGVLVACDNEPFPELSLRVTSFQNIEGKVLKKYQYDNSLLHQYVEVDQKANDTTQSSLFLFDGEYLDRIISDSVIDEKNKTYSFKLTEIYYDGTMPVGDSTFLVTKSSRSKLSVHSFQFDTDNNLVHFTTTAFTNNAVDSVVAVDLVRESGNVVKLSRYRVAGENKTLRRELTFTYEDHKAILPLQRFEYFYTLDADEAYLMSVNNPAVIKEKGQKDVLCAYTYNRFDHPAYFKKGSTQFNVSYTSF